MTTQEKLAMLKADLQMLTSANDEYLTTLIGVAEAAVTREGIVDDGSMDYNAAVVSYAAYLFRKRAASTSGSYGSGGGSETSMPRFLRYMLNNLLLSQKMQEGGS